MQFLGRSGVDSLLGCQRLCPHCPSFHTGGLYSTHRLPHGRSCAAEHTCGTAQTQRSPLCSPGHRVAPSGRIAALRQHSAAPARQARPTWYSRVPYHLGSDKQDQRLRLCSCADAIADPIPDCGTNGHADRQRCALAGSHAAGSARVPWLLQARSRRSPSRRPRARRGRGAARRAHRMVARLPRRATRAKQLQQAHHSCSSARCQRQWAICGASAG